MILAVVIVLLTVLGVLAAATVAATRADDLLVFYWGKGRLFLFARGEDGGYDRVPLWAAPITVIRVEARRLRTHVRQEAPAPAQTTTGRPAARFARLAH